MKSMKIQAYPGGFCIKQKANERNIIERERKSNVLKFQHTYGVSTSDLDYEYTCTSRFDIIHGLLS